MENKFKLLSADKQYSNTFIELVEKGQTHHNRTGVDTKRLFGRSFEFDLESLPILTNRSVAFKNTLAELLWFISGSTKLEDLHKIHPPAVKWWQDFDIGDGSIGDLYGEIYRDKNRGYFDQIRWLEHNIKSNPDSRRLLLSSYNPYLAHKNEKKGGLYPCHGLTTQFSVGNTYLSCCTYQRSADFGCGLPHNWLSYGLLVNMLARVCGLKPGILTYFVGDLHLYNNHEPIIKENMPLNTSFSHPKLTISSKPESIIDFKLDDFKLVDYKSGSKLNLPLAV